MTDITKRSESSLFNKTSSSLPLVSIGVASYNNAHYITETLDSIYLLNYVNKELIIVDDASTDNSVEVIKGWISSHPALITRLVQHPTNKGVCQVCNQIVEEAKGEFIAMIGSDDLYKPHMVTEALAELERRGPDFGVVYADCEIIDKSGSVLSSSFLKHFDESFGPDYPSGNIRIPLLQGFYLPAATVLMRRSVLLQAGPYDNRLIAEDLDMWLRLCLLCQFAFVPQVFSAYRIHGLSITQSNKPGLNETFFSIYKKTKFASGKEIEAAQRMLAEHAEHYYASKGNAAAPILWYTFRQTKKLKILAFWLMSRTGLSYSAFRQIIRR